MAIGANFFQRTFGRIKVDTSNDAVTVHVSFEAFGKKLDQAQEALDAQVWNDMKQYMPFGNGSLIQQTELLNHQTRGEVYKYPPGHDYGHYLYVGEKYVDPKYHKGGFTDGERWWSRPGVTKVPSGEPLNYSPTHNPMAGPKWDEQAIENHMNDWKRVVRNALK